MNMERLDGENSGEDMSQDKTAQSIYVQPASSDSGSAAAVVDHVGEIPEQYVHVKTSTVHAQKQPVIIQKIALGLLVPSPYNSRRFRPESSIQNMVQSLAAHGQREALRVYPGEGERQGKYEIVSGVTRFLAATTLGWSALDVIIDPTLNPHDPLSLIRLSRIYNDTAAETDMDHAATVADLADKDYSQEAIMKAMGFKLPRKLFKLRAFGELPEAIFEIAAQHPHKITAEFAAILKSAVAELGADKATLLAEELIADNLSKEKLIGRIKTERRKIADKPTRAIKERARLIHFSDTQAGDLRLMRYPNSDEKRVKLDILLPKAAAKNLFAEIENLIQRMNAE
ncbi:MAG: ParB N-terminal domain-containing protein [Betaproteobacteria bacterium]|nr:ParB N-terminal domain-containing protein [Betaproteobacteria bacterium]